LHDRSHTPRAGTGTWRYAFAVALGVLLLLVLRFDFVCDDAYIAFRYARHLAEGHGLRFNLGESPPVEGYTNLLWVLWLALFERLGADPALVARVSSGVCGVLLLALATRVVVRRFALPLPLATADALFLACLPPMSLWSTSGLETMPFALAVFAAWERLAGDPDRPRGVQAGLCALAAALLRADGALWAAFAFAAAAAGGVRIAWPMLCALAILAAGEIAHLFWRHGYHGDWIPNTARVKAGLSAMRLERGLKYVVAFGLEVLPVLLVPILALLARANRHRGLAIQAAMFLVLAVAYSVFVGGDFMPMGRFLLPAMPFLAILLASVLDRWRSTPRSLGLAGGCIALSLLPDFGVHVVPLSLRERFHFRWNQREMESELEMWRGMRDRAREWALLGRAMAAEVEPQASIILGNIGAVGYFTDLEILDPFGLVDPDVARRDTPPVRASPGHDKRVPVDFFAPRRPTYLGAWLAPGSTPPERVLPAEWLAMLRSDRVELVRRPLRAEQGFPAGLELRLLRFRWI